jgi:AcrR family transcriptional regulator
MLDQGHQVIRERGLTVGLDDIRMEDLIAAAEVPRSSVWRIWTAKAEYAADLLVSAVDPRGANVLRTILDEETLDVAQAQLAGLADRLDTPGARRAALEHIVRTAVEHNYLTFAGSRAWRTYFALLASLPAVHQMQVRQAIAGRMYDAEREFAARMGTFYATIAPQVGIRLRRPEAGWEAMALACSAVVEGLALRSEIYEPVEREAEPEPPAPRGARAAADADGEQEPTTDWGTVRPTIGELVEGPHSTDADDWTTAAIAILGIIDAFTEPDPEAPSA